MYNRNKANRSVKLRRTRSTDFFSRHSKPIREVDNFGVIFLRGGDYRAYDSALSAIKVSTSINHKEKDWNHTVAFCRGDGYFVMF